MSKRITLNPYFMDEKTMTPEQYLEKLKQEALDKEFDELAKENNKRIAEEQLKQEKQEELKLLMRTLWDCEDELYIAEELYKNMLIDSDSTKAQKDDLSKFIKSTKIKQSKIRSKLDQL